MGYFIAVYWHTSCRTRLGTATTVKVSRGTLGELERLRDELKARSLEETIRALIRKHRSELLAEAFGADRGRIRHFTEVDRGENR